MDNDSANINSLPHELMVDVLSRVASSSFTDLFNSKLCCKDFMGAAEEDGILEQVCLEKFPVIHQWLKSYKLNWFMNRCMASGNPEALYRQGLVEYFTHMRTQSGLENLRRAAEKGHVEATYVYGILLLCLGGQFSKEGLNLLNAMERISTSSHSGGSKLFQGCREKIKGVFRVMWINNQVVDQRISSCRHPNPIVRVIETWDGRCEEEEDGTRVIETWEGHREEEEDGTRCELCKWDRGVEYFTHMRTQSELENLRRATEKGHVKATYIRLRISAWKIEAATMHTPKQSAASTLYIQIMRKLHSQLIQYTNSRCFRNLLRESERTMDNDPANINSLPHELLVDVLSRVASSSFTDLFNSKLWSVDG
ncbi:hypothetical protein Vadar_011239 [Vaccinium darrowii]|uniref:Uncharacterized protein n=1 Tax=Vaccinium darrowii TaxID=229202 RepID=A0ACB7ZJS1_9ERIC|nr:hypothetical protein Vadar_011239 [Vaccinium darrowii]